MMGQVQQLPPPGLPRWFNGFCTSGQDSWEIL